MTAMMSDERCHPASYDMQAMQRLIEAKQKQDPRGETLVPTAPCSSVLLLGTMVMHDRHVLPAA